MIAGDKGMLQASLTQAVLKMQTRLVTHYNNSLRAVAITGSKMAVCACGVFGLIIDHSKYVYSEHMMYVFYCLNFMSFATGMFSVCQATIVRVFGPTLALSGTTSEVVMATIHNMETELKFAIRIAFVAIVSGMLSLCVLDWMRLDFGIAAMDSVLYIVGIVMLVKKGKETHHLFKYEEPPSFNAATGRESIGPRPSIGDMTRPSIGNDSLFSRPSSASIYDVEDLVKFASSKVRGELYWREPLIAGGLLRQVYVTLRKGKLEIYKCQADFEEDEDPLNPRPINVWEYEVELNPKIYAHDIIGQTDFCLPMMMSSKIKEAAKKYKFALMPKVFSELRPLDAVEFMALDERSFTLWVNALKKTIQAHEELGGREGVLAVIRSYTDTKKIIKVENALSAANTEHAVAL